MLSSCIAFLLAAQMILSAPSQGDQSKSTELDLARRMARHFPERPPLLFEFEPGAEHGPRIIITNLYQHALTALVIKRESKSLSELPQTIFLDALTRSALLAPIPRGLSFVMSLGLGGGGAPPPSATLVAAIWEDGSAYGPDDLLAEIATGRTAIADMYRRSISLLQRGLDEHWTHDQYISAAEALGHSITAPNSLHWPETAPPRAVVLGITSTLNVPSNSEPTRLEKAVKAMIVQFKNNIDAIQEAASWLPTSRQQQNP